jgi:hypothetical protein
VLSSGTGLWLRTGTHMVCSSGTRLVLSSGTRLLPSSGTRHWVWSSCASRDHIIHFPIAPCQPTCHHGSCCSHAPALPPQLKGNHFGLVNPTGTTYDNGTVSQVPPCTRTPINDNPISIAPETVEEVITTLAQFIDKVGV